MAINQKAKERIIENYLKNYNTYKVGILNCQKQLDYISPTLVTGYNALGNDSLFYIKNDTSAVAIDRIESKRALDLKEEIVKNSLIIDSIDRAVAELQEKPKIFVKMRYFEGKSMNEILEVLNYAEAKSAYKIRREVLDYFFISLHNLVSFHVT